MEVNKLADTLDDNLFSDKNFKKAYVVYSFWAILTPIITILFSAIGLDLPFYSHMMIASVLFVITKIMELVFNFRNMKLKKPNIMHILMLSLCVWFLLTSLILGAINVNFIIGFCYFLFFALFCNVEKKHFATLAKLFIAQMVFSTILGLFDLYNSWVPGFYRDSCGMSMQFWNPNWSGFVVIIAEIAALWFVFSSKLAWQKTLYLIAYLIMTIGLFVGGSYAPEASLFLCLVALVIYLWIKYKKCPWWIFSAFLATVFISFAVWWVPVVSQVSTANANFFYESLGVIDNNLKTHLVRDVSTVFDKLFGWGVKDFISGSDGWKRGSLQDAAFNAIFASPQSFFLGYGSAFIYDVRVHNVYLVLWMEFGFFAIILFLAMCVMLLVRFIRVRKTDLLVFVFACFVMMLFESLFCCIEFYCFPFFVILAAVLYKLLYTAELKQVDKKQEIADSNSETKPELEETNKKA